MGRHTSGRTFSPMRIVGVVAGLAVLLGGGATAYAALNGKPTPKASESSSSTPASTTSSSSSPSGSESTSPSASPTTDAAAAAAMASCRTEVSSGEALAQAAAASAKDWRAHAGAQWSLDSGKITYAQAEAIWAASKKNAATDLSGFASAWTAYQAAAGGCATVASATASSPDAATATACAARGTALAEVATTGKVVNDQWAAHVAQMKTKATAAGPAYHAKWMDFVSEAKGAFSAYDAKVAALSKAPTCS